MSSYVELCRAMSSFVKLCQALLFACSAQACLSVFYGVVALSCTVTHLLALLLRLLALSTLSALLAFAFSAVALLCAVFLFA